MGIKSKKVLVTGADGFIGSHLTEQLVKEGADVRAFVFYNSFNSWGWLEDLPIEIRKEIKVVSGDIRDAGFVRESIKGCDIVFNLAALIAIPFSYHAPESYIDTNVKGVLNILQGAREAGARVIHTSTSEVYGTPQSIPIKETHAINAQSPYAASKAAADQLALSFYYSFKQPISILRPFNTYGPRQSARAIIPTVITQIANKAREIKIGNIHPTRDFNFVSDTVRGFISAAGSDKALGQIINTGSNFEISMGDTVKLISELMGAPVDIKMDNERVRPQGSEVERLCADNSKAKEILDWEPEFKGINGFKKGLEKTISWFTEEKNLARYKSGLYNL